MGLATASLLIAKGHQVTITGRNADRLDNARLELGANVNTVVMDAASTESLGDAFASIGAFDHLVLALGSSKGIGPFSSISLDEVRAGFDEKFFAHFASAQAALGYLRKDGSITFVSGVAAHSAIPGTAAIGASNAAIAALVPILAVELGPLRVNTVSPGVVDTPWWDFMNDNEKASTFGGFAQKTPVGRVGQPEDIAKAIAFLIDDTFVSGHALVCDGGKRWTN